MIDETKDNTNAPAAEAIEPEQSTPAVEDELKQEPEKEVPTCGPRGAGAPPDSMDENARAAMAADEFEKSKSTVTDTIDSFGNPQLAEENGEMVEHHTNIGPRGAGAPKDTYRA